MRKKLAFCLPAVLFAGVLAAPAGFAADKFDVAAFETFDPLGLFGPVVGYFASEPTVTCPGYEPTGDPMQPCPVGSRTHVRNFLVVSRVESADPSMSGWMTVELNSNMAADFTGPVWGTFSIALDAGGSWEGTWQGLRVAEEGYWAAPLHVEAKGYGGVVDGQKLMAEDYIITYTPMPIAYFGFIEGRVVDPN